MAANRKDISTNETVRFIAVRSSFPNGRTEFSWSPNAVSAALTTSETMRRNPSAATNPRLVARARMSRDTGVPFWLGLPYGIQSGLHFPNTPDAVAINVTMPTIVATMPDDLPAALAKRFAKPLRFAVP